MHPISQVLQGGDQAGSQAGPHVVAFGEMLLRLKAPGNERLLQTTMLEATFGGAEANVAVALASDGIATSFVTVAPDNALGEAGLGELRRYGVDVTRTVRRPGRLGTYYLEAGAGHRASRVLYDRADSTLALADAGAIDWNAALAGATWFHLSGITPAISASAAALTLEGVKVARKLGVTISCDYNHRASLWQYGKKPAEVMREIVSYVDIGIAGRSDCQEMLGIVPTRAPSRDGIDHDWFREVAQQVLDDFPSMRMQVITLRDGNSAAHYGWSACALDRNAYHVSTRYEVEDVVDRVGTGDAFAAGLLYAIVTGRDNASALEFATAASCLKHTIPGDFNRVSAAEVDALLAGEGGGRIKR